MKTYFKTHIMMNTIHWVEYNRKEAGACMCVHNEKRYQAYTSICMTEIQNFINVFCYLHTVNIKMGIFTGPWAS